MGRKTSSTTTRIVRSTGCPPKSTVTFVCDHLIIFKRFHLVELGLFVIYIYILDSQIAKWCFLKPMPPLASSFDQSFGWTDWSSVPWLSSSDLCRSISVCFILSLLLSVLNTSSTNHEGTVLHFGLTDPAYMRKQSLLLCKPLFFQKISLQGATQYIQKANIQITSLGKTQQQFVQWSFLIQPPTLRRFGAVMGYDLFGGQFPSCWRCKTKIHPNEWATKQKIALTGCLIGILIHSGLLYLCFIPTQLGNIPKQPGFVSLLTGVFWCTQVTRDLASAFTFSASKRKGRLRYSASACSKWSTYGGSKVDPERDGHSFWWGEGHHISVGKGDMVMTKVWTPKNTLHVMMGIWFRHIKTQTGWQYLRYRLSL